MSFFKKLFEGNKVNQENKKFNLEVLLTSPDINSSIIELDDYIGDLCSYGDALEKLTLPQKYFYFNQNLEREVNNGGFSQYFINSSGEFAHETLTSLRSIGTNKTASILQDAMAQFPDSLVPKDRAVRQQIVVQIEEVANKAWDELDKQFFTYEDNLSDLAIHYVKQNKIDFK